MDSRKSIAEKLKIILSVLPEGYSIAQDGDAYVVLDVDGVEECQINLTKEALAMTEDEFRRAVLQSILD